MNSQTAITFAIICGFLAPIALVCALPTGAPTSACQTLVPQHPGVTPSNATTPYVIDVSSTPIIPGGRSYLITLRGISPSTTLSGYMIQARNAANTAQYLTYGSFDRFDPMDNEIQAITCRTSGDTVTHTNSNPKGQVIIKWNAPSTGTGTVRFVGTIADSYTLIFANQTSVSLTYG